MVKPFAVTAHPQAAHLLAEDLPPALGRDNTIDSVISALSDAECRGAALIAPGGVGKSYILRELLENRQEDFVKGTGINEVYVFSFYSQGSNDRVVAADEFFKAMFTHLGIDPALWEKDPLVARGKKLAEVLAERKILVVLDGLEPLLFAEKANYGRFKDDGIYMFLQEMFDSQRANSKVLVTTRVPLLGLQPVSPLALKSIDVPLLSQETAQLLLEREGVKGTEGARREVASYFMGHALATVLAGKHIREFYGGDPERFLEKYREYISTAPAEFIQRREEGNHGMNAYLLLDFIVQSSPKSDELSTLQLIGLFDRPVHRALFDKLRSDESIAGPSLTHLQPEEFDDVLQRLRKLGLIAKPSRRHPEIIDAHPLVREYFAYQFSRSDQNAWNKACHSIAEYYVGVGQGAERDSEFFLQRYLAVRYYCLAKEFERAKEVLDDVWQANKPRQEQFRATRVYGLYGSEMVALACFFDEFPHTFLPEVAQEFHADLLTEVGMRLRSSGRIEESIVALEGADRAIRESGAPIKPQNVQGTCNLGDMHAARGNFEIAVQICEKALQNADAIGDVSKRVVARSRLAEVLWYRGTLENNADDRTRAETLIQEILDLHQNFPDLRYIESQTLGTTFRVLVGKGRIDDATQLLAKIREHRPDNHESISLLGLGIRRLGAGLVAFGQGGFQEARDFFNDAITYIFRAGFVDYLVPTYMELGRAESKLNHPEAAARAFERAWASASNAKMNLYLRLLKALDTE